MKQTTQTTTLPPYTKKQKQIIDFLYQFRFLNTKHFQKLFNHKDPHRIKAWLKDLVDKKYLESDYKKNMFPQKPGVYSLTKTARKLLKQDKDNSLSVLDLVYRRKGLSEQFINHHLTIADIYLFFLSQKEKDSKLQFFTKYDLVDYEYLQPLALDAYIAKKTKEKTTRYFLHLFDPYTPPFVYRKKVKNYLKYYDEDTWKENTEDPAFPTVLFVCHSDNARKHVLHYAKSVFDREFEEKYSLYVTTKEIILSSKEDIWKKV